MWLSAMTATLLMFASVIATIFLYAKGWQHEVIVRVPWFFIGDSPVDVIVLADNLSMADVVDGCTDIIPRALVFGWLHGR